jgi:hypothetical protein
VSGGKRLKNPAGSGAASDCSQIPKQGRQLTPGGEIIIGRIEKGLRRCTHAACQKQTGDRAYLRLHGWMTKKRQGQMTDPASVKLYLKIRCKPNSLRPFPIYRLSGQLHFHLPIRTILVPEGIVFPGDIPVNPFVFTRASGNGECTCPVWPQFSCLQLFSAPSDSS